MNTMKLSIFLCLLLLAKLASSQCSDTQCLGYDKDVASYAVQYAVCSNVVTPYLDQITNWTYQPCLAAQKKENVKDIVLIHQAEKYLLGFTAYDTQRNLVVASFRATTTQGNDSNEWRDVDIIPENYVNTQIGGNCKRDIIPSEYRCNAHSGFYNGYQSLKGDVRKNILALLTKYQTLKPRVLVTGVSLGAALAAFAIMDLATYFKFINKDVVILPYTFGQPRIGNEMFIKQIDQTITIFRVVYRADPVPHMPPRQVGFYFYYNPGVQIFYQSLTDKQPLACAGDGSSCSLNRYPQFVVCNHLEYPNIQFSQTEDCKVQVCKTNFEISFFQIVEQFEEVVTFLYDFVTEKTVPPCLAGIQYQANVENKTKATVLFEDLASIVSTRLLSTIEGYDSKTEKPSCPYWICDPKNLNDLVTGYKEIVAKKHEKQQKKQTEEQL